MNTLTQFIIHHWQLWLALAIAVGMLLFEETKYRGHLFLTPEKLAIMLNHADITIVDLRPPEEFAKGHILNAINMPQATLIAKGNTLPSNKLVLVDKDGHNAITSYQKLKHLNLGEIFILQQGFQAWQNQNLPIIKGN